MKEQDPSREQDRKEILSHIDATFRAYIDRDEKAIEATHLESWKGFTVRSRTTVHSRDQYLQEVRVLLKNQYWKFYEISDFDISFHGDAAIATYIACVSGKDAMEKYFETKIRVMDIYVKNGHGWNLAASSVSLHPDIIDRQLNAAISALTMQ